MNRNRELAVALRRLADRVEAEPVPVTKVTVLFTDPWRHPFVADGRGHQRWAWEFDTIDPNLSRDFGSPFLDTHWTRTIDVCD